MSVLVTRARVVVAAAALGGAAARGSEARAQDSAAALPTREDPRVVRVYTSDRVWNGVTTTRDGRVFVVYVQAEGPGVQVAELGAGGAPRPFPDAAWNAPGNADSASGADVSRPVVHVNALRIGPDGALWLVDAGASFPGKPAVRGGARLFRVDLAGGRDSGRVSRVYDLGTVTGPTSYVDDVRFHGGLAYLTDAGQPGLIVLDLASGRARRVLDHQPSTTDRRPTVADGRRLLDPQGRGVLIHADQLEVSPDGATLYFQPASGPMSRIATRWLDDTSATPAAVAAHVAPFADTPTTGGTAIDANGVLYLSDANRRRVLRITPGGAVSTLAADPRFVWVDAMWIDAAGDLWMPVPQLNRTPGVNGGRMAVEYPVAIYRLHVGAGPPASDHP